jgi:hypothetical protein
LVAGSARPWISWRSGGHLASCRKGLSRTSQNKCGQNGSKLRRSPTHRRLLYEAAFLTGLRASELRRLTLEHLDVEHSGLQLESEWTKNRKSCFQPLPKDLANKLYEFARSEEPSRLYAKFHKRKQHTATMPKQPLFYVPSHTARSVDQDLLSAGIPKHGPGGKIDFHAIRKAYINLVIESGVTVKEAQTLARHASPELTMNVYGHAREDRLADAVERVAEVVLPVRRVPVEYQQAVGAETENATSDKTEGCVSYKWWRRRKSNPSKRKTKNPHPRGKATQKLYKTTH